MRLEDLTPEDITSIIRGEHPEYPKSNFLGKGADGVVYVNPNDSTRAVKFQVGTEKAYKNEIDNLFEAQLRELDTPAVYESGFTPIYETESGYSYIDQDKLDFDKGYNPSSKGTFRKAQALARLFNIGVDHNDTHGGNIRYNSTTDTPSIIDFSRAKDLDKGLNGISKRDNNVQKGLDAAGDTDIARIYKSIVGDLGQEAFGSGDPADIETYRDFVDQGEEILERSEFTGDDSSPTYTKPDATPPHLKGDTSFKSSTTDLTAPRFSGSPLKGALSLGLPDLIPSRETIRMAGSGDFAGALKNHSAEVGKGMVVAGGVAAVTPAAPVVGTLAGAAAPGLIAVAAGEAADELVTQATGEGIISKAQQAIGTKERTGIASPGGSVEETNKREMDRVANPPEIKPMTGPPRRSSLKKSPAPELGRRLRLAGDRFNLSKGEFGISELLFGR